MIAEHEPGTAALGQMVRDVAARVTSADPSMQITIGIPGGGAVECVEIPLVATGQFLDELARELARSKIDVADVWIQQRGAASSKAQHANGITVRAPLVADGAACAVDAGLPAPTCWWNTTDQTVLAWVFPETMDLWVAIAIVEEFSLAIEGAELGYAAAGTRCSLPAGVQVHQGGPLLDAAALAPSFPPRLRELLRTCIDGDSAELDPVALLPATWAGVEVLRHAVRHLAEAKKTRFVPMATRVWLRAKGYAEMALKLASLPAGDRRLDRMDVPEYVRLCYERIGGIDAAGAFHLYFDDVTHDVRLLEGDRSYALKIKSETLFNKAHRHEQAATLAHEVTVRVDEDPQTQRSAIRVASAVHLAAESLGNKILIGHTGTLAALGVPRIVRHEFLAAFTEDRWSIGATTRAVSAVRVACLREVADESFDVVEYFLALHRAGRLPLATEDDVRRLLMALASPLLRHVAPGLLGIYWLLGPPGSGKDFLAELLPDIHRQAVAGVASPKFTISLTNELEDKRQFYAAGPAIYARAKEAGKRAAMAEQLIRLAGTDQLPARGMKENEIAIANVFTYLADSAEDPPSRIEISRRTVEIRVLHVDDEVSLGHVRQEILTKAPQIVAALRRLVEQNPKDWFVNQSQTKSRPAVPVALAQIFDVKLDEVEGRNLDELFEAMLLYTSDTNYCGTEGAEQRQHMRARKDKESHEAVLFKSYRFSHFIDKMQNEPGMKALFAELRSQRLLTMTVQREMKKYRDVTRGKALYLPVKINGTRYAFKMFRSGRNFMLEELKIYEEIMSNPGVDSDTQQGTQPDLRHIGVFDTQYPIVA
ncbi:MAG TPA: hypothetical protein VFP84_37840 [Kofleriaceae bacterium]|nr:hypothetical protein [Kofleriaceae bacterium]